MDILHGIEAKTLALRTSPPGQIMAIADIELPMERPLHTPTLKPLIADIELESGDADMDATALCSQIVIDKAQLGQYIRHALQDRSQVTLHALCEMQPRQHGLSELVAYLQLAGDTFKTVVDEDSIDTIAWKCIGSDGLDYMKQTRLPRVIFMSAFADARGNPSRIAAGPPKSLKCATDSCLPPANAGARI